MGEMRRIYARAAVLDNAAYRFGIGQHGSNGNAAAPRSRLHHRLHGIHHQIHDHLIKLGAVPGHPRNRRRQLEGNGEPL